MTNTDRKASQCTQGFSERKVTTQTCVFCNGPHTPTNCHTVRDPKQRLEIVRQNKLCFNCLERHRVSHSAILNIAVETAHVNITLAYAVAQRTCQINSQQLAVHQFNNLQTVQQSSQVRIPKLLQLTQQLLMQLLLLTVMEHSPHWHPQTLNTQ